MNAGRVHVGYTQVHPVRGRWTQPFCCLPAGEADAYRAAVDRAAGPADAARRQWRIIPCSCETNR